MRKPWCCLVVLAWAGCKSGNSDPGPSSGLDRSAVVGDLTAPQRDSLCDWTAERQGGYGRAVDCPGGSTETTDDDRADCLEGVTVIEEECPTITVADIEDCTNANHDDICTGLAAS